MTYYMVFLTNGNHFQHKSVCPVYEGEEIFMSTSKKQANEFVKQLNFSFPEAEYKIVPVEV